MHKSSMAQEMGIRDDPVKYSINIRRNSQHAGREHKAYGAHRLFNGGDPG